MNRKSLIIKLALSIVICSVAISYADIWRQYRSFGGSVLEGDIKTIISDIRYLYAFSSGTGVRYDKLLDKWDFSFIGHLPPTGYQFTALDRYFNDFYFVYNDRMIPYRAASDMQYPAIMLPETIIQTAFGSEGIWVRTAGGYFLCDRWTGKCSKEISAPQQLEWFGRVEAESIKKDSRLYFLSEPIWDNFAGRHYLTAYATEFAGNYVWAAYSGMGLWRFDLITGKKTQLTRGFLASTDASGLYCSGNTVGICGQGGLTLIGIKDESWQQIGRLFNLDLSNYSLNCLAFDERRIFIGTDRGVVVFKRGDDFATSITTYDGLPDDMVTSLALQSDTLWIGTRYGPAFYSLKSGARAFSYGLEDWAVSQIAVSPAQVYLATSRGGLISEKSDSLKISRYGQSSPVEMDGEMLGVAVDGPTVWWLSGDVLLCYDGQKRSWSKYPSAGNYAAGRNVSLSVDGRNVWIGTDAGLVRYDKTNAIWRVYHKEDGLVDDYVSCVLSAGGVLWAGSPSGLSSFDWQKADQGK